MKYLNEAVLSIIPMMDKDGRKVNMEVEHNDEGEIVLINERAPYPFTELYLTIQQARALMSEINKHITYAR